MKNHKTTPLGLGAAAALLVLCGGTACAQPKSHPGDGRALDGGLSANGDRYNTRTRDLNAMIRFNDAVISGNAPGGKSFRGGTSLNGTSQFRGSLGSSGVYSFQRDSALSGTAARGVRSSTALDYLFRAQTGGYNEQSMSSFLSPRDPLATGATGRSVRSASAADSTSSRLPTVMGYSRDTDGRDTVVTASPLGGVRTNPLSTQILTGLEPTAPGITPLSDFLNDRERNKALEPANDTRLNKPDIKPPSINPLDTRLEPSTSPYGKVLDEFRTRRSDAKPLIGPDGRPLPPGTGPDGKPLLPGMGPDGKPLPPDGNQPRPPVGAEPTDPGAKPKWLDDLDTLRERLRPREDDLAPRTMPVPPIIGNDRGGASGPRKPIQPGTPGLTPGQTGVKDLEVTGVLKRMGPRVESLYEPDATGMDFYGRQMSAGQKNMGEARFFDAEENFAAAISAKPHDVLALVGRMHAQLGAGLFLSAAANMRTLFTEHPELIPVKFAPGAMMSRTWAAGQAERLLAEINRPTGVMADEAGMLLAYLGFQYGEPFWLETGVTAMQVRFRPGGSATAALVELLGAVWPARATGAPPALPMPPTAAPNPPKGGAK